MLDADDDDWPDHEGLKKQNPQENHKNLSRRKIINSLQNHVFSTKFR